MLPVVLPAHLSWPAGQQLDADVVPAAEERPQGSPTPHPPGTVLVGRRRELQPRLGAPLRGRRLWDVPRPADRLELRRVLALLAVLTLLCPAPAAKDSQCVLHVFLLVENDNGITASGEARGHVQTGAHAVAAWFEEVVLLLLLLLLFGVRPLLVVAVAGADAAEEVVNASQAGAPLLPELVRVAPPPLEDGQLLAHEVGHDVALLVEVPAHGDADDPSAQGAFKELPVLLLGRGRAPAAWRPAVLSSLLWEAAGDDGEVVHASAAGVQRAEGHPLTHGQDQAAEEAEDVEDDDKPEHGPVSALQLLHPGGIARHGVLVAEDLGVLRSSLLEAIDGGQARERDRDEDGPDQEGHLVPEEEQHAPARDGMCHQDGAQRVERHARDRLVTQL
mmetsp:Transcript_81181/g.224692  ORF Transcript_81181/g.224692 Transcript_81181/m.224692 type:complete len:390 (-) Transcript_81181:537-1706(-)